MIYIILFVVSTIIVSFYTFFEMSYLLIPKKSLNKEGKIYVFLKKPDSVIITVLLGTNLFAISASMFFRKFIGGEVVGGGLLVTIILFIFSEMLPKNLATYLYDKLFYLLSPFIWGTYVLFLPIILIIRKITKHFYDKNSDISISRDIEAISYISEMKKGLSEHSVGSYMTVIVDTIRFMSSRVMDYSIHLREVNFVNIDNPDLTKTKLNGFSIVYRSNIDNIIGILKSKYVYLIEKGLITINEAIDEPVFVHEKQSIKNVLSVLRDRGQSEAVVVDEHGNIKGVFAVYIFKELISGVSDRHFITVFGEDKLEKLAKLCKEVNTYNMSMTIHEFLKSKMGSEIKPGISITLGNCRFTVLSMKEGIIGRILVDKIGEENGTEL